jgi:hypothetical protein
MLTILARPNIVDKEPTLMAAATANRLASAPQRFVREVLGGTSPSTGVSLTTPSLSKVPSTLLCFGASVASPTNCRTAVKAVRDEPQGETAWFGLSNFLRAS